MTKVFDTVSEMLRDAGFDEYKELIKDNAGTKKLVILRAITGLSADEMRKRLGWSAPQLFQFEQAVSDHDNTPEDVEKYRAIIEQELENQPVEKPRHGADDVVLYLEGDMSEEQQEAFVDELEESRMLQFYVAVRQIILSYANGHNYANTAWSVSFD